MLRELHITNLAVIEDVSVTFDDGLNCFTGATGAGKSLLIGAFEILLCLRGATDMIRPGADEARVAGLFELNDPAVCAQIGPIIDATIEPGEQLLITRKLFASGRSSVSVNGQPTTTAMARAVGEQIVDVHGQHDHQFLLKPLNQLAILDAYGQCGPLCNQFANTFGELRELEQRHEQLTASAALRRQQLELYKFQADEIDAALLVDGEYPELKARYALLSNLQRIKHDAAQVHASLYDNDGSINERLQAATQVLLDLAELDDSLGNIAEQVRNATLALQESAFELGRYANRLDLDPGELAEIEDRLNTLNRLLSKYVDGRAAAMIEPQVLRSGVDQTAGTDARSAADCDPIAQVLVLRQSIEQEIVRLRGENDDFSSMHQGIDELREALAAVGSHLSAKRHAAAAKLRPLIEKQLGELGMGEAAFDVSFDVAAEADSPTGLDTVEMLVRTNPGQPSRPLRKIASGGELSRMMLAIKSILAQSDRISVLVFDEIDANIGGRMGTIIGAKLQKLASASALSRSGATQKDSRHQVICITHLPQIAAFADHHIHIAKHVTGRGKGKQTRTTVTPLQGESRIDELAQMLAGENVSKTTRKQARELLNAAVPVTVH